MKQKRKAVEALGKGKPQLSAFAAAKLARQTSQATPALSSDPVEAGIDANLATAAAAEPYDGHHSEASTASVIEVDEQPVTTPTSKPPPTNLSTFRPDSRNVIADNEERLEVVLQYNDTVTSVGEYDLEVTSGIATVYGTVLRPDSGPNRVFATSTHALPQIQARQDGTKIQLVSVKSSLRKLESLSPLFRNIWAGTSSHGRSFAVLDTSDDDTYQRSISALETERDIDATLRILSAKTAAEPRKPRVMAVGAKASGKSTFNRILCNHLNSWIAEPRVFYLDLDPGQPEFGPAGHVSLVEVSAPLLGPSFTHHATRHSSKHRLVRSHAIAAMSFKDDPEHYKACASELIRHATKKYPLIVNSCGWASGLGASVLTNLVSDLSISDVVLMEPLDGTLVQALRAEADTHAAFHQVPRRAPKPSSRTPAETRAMQTMSYFHDRPSNNTRLPKFSGSPINKVRPWLVSYAGANPGITAISSYGTTPHPDYLQEVLNGSLVALCTVGDASTPLSSHLRPPPDAKLEEKSLIAHDLHDLPYIKTTPESLPRSLDPSTTSCAGMALVRGIDTENKLLHILTPLPPDEVMQLGQTSLILVRGSFDCPEWAYVEDLYAGEAEDADLENRPWVSRRDTGAAGMGVEGGVWRIRRPPMPGGK